MDKTKTNWYVLDPPKKLVLVHNFHYDEEKDYGEQWLKFLSKNGITADRIIKQEQVQAGYDEIHVLGEDGIQQYSLVKFNSAKAPVGDCGFKDGQKFVFLGEIPNMPGHCVVADLDTGVVHAGYHIENFEVINDI